MKENVKTPLLVVVVVIIVAAVVFFGIKTIGGSGNLDQGQVQYTPGKPPWEETDPSKKGPGGAPGVPPSGTPDAGAPSGGPAVAPGGAPVGPPVLGNTGK